MTRQEALEALEKLAAELREAERSRDETGLSPEGFAAYWYLRREGLPQATHVAEEASASLRAYPHW